MMAGTYTRTVCNKNNFSTVSSSYNCKTESISRRQKNILVKCLCNWNQQDMQVEGCELTPFLSPRVHQFTSQTGDRKKKLLLGIRTKSLGYPGEHAQLTPEPLNFRTVSSISTGTMHSMSSSQTRTAWHCVEELDKNCLALYQGVRQKLFGTMLISQTENLGLHVRQLDRNCLALCQAVRQKPFGTMSRGQTESIWLHVRQLDRNRQMETTQRHLKELDRKGQAP